MGDKIAHTDRTGSAFITPIWGLFKKFSFDIRLGFRKKIFLFYPLHGSQSQSRWVIIIMEKLVTFISKLKTWIQPKTQFKYAHWMKILSLRQNYFKNWLTKTALAAKHATNFLKFCSPPINTNKETRIQGLACMHSSMSRIFNTDHKFHPSQNRQTESAWTCLQPRNTLPLAFY